MITLYISQTPTPIPPIPLKLRKNLVARWQMAAVVKICPDPIQT